MFEQETQSEVIPPLIHSSSIPSRISFHGKSQRKHKDGEYYGTTRSKDLNHVYKTRLRQHDSINYKEEGEDFILEESKSEPMNENSDLFKSMTILTNDPSQLYQDINLYKIELESLKDKFLSDEYDQECIIISYISKLREKYLSRSLCPNKRKYKRI